MGGQPLRAETEALLDAVNTLRLDRLRDMTDDEHGIVDVDPEGKTVVIDTRAEWDAYMERNVAAMRVAGATLGSEILDYHGVKGDDLGWSVVRFRQDVGVGGRTLRHWCVATIVWRRDGDRWLEARWHCSRERTEAA